MAKCFLLFHSRQSTSAQLWGLDTDSQTDPLTRQDAGPDLDLPDNGYYSTTVGSYVLRYRPPYEIKDYGENYVDFQLLKSQYQDDTLQFSLVQQGSWEWTKFSSGYAYTSAPYGEQSTYLTLTGVTGYVFSRISSPGRSGFGLWGFDAHDTVPGGAEDPIAEYTYDPDAFPNVGEYEELVPINNRVMVIDRSAGSYRLFSFDPQLPNPLGYKALSNGSLPEKLGSQILVVGEQLLVYTPDEASFTVYDFTPDAPFSNPQEHNWPDELEVDGHTTVCAVEPPEPVDATLASTPGTVDFMREQIDHVVYYVLESRSFDSVVGWLYDTADESEINWVGANSKPPFKGASESNFNEDSYGKKWYQEKYEHGAVNTDITLDSPVIDPFHGTPDAIRQQWSKGYAAYEEGAQADMGGFVLNNGNSEVMQAYSPDQLGILNGLASWYGVSDLWFSPEAGGTTTNRATIASGSAYNITTSYEGGPPYVDFCNTQRRQSLWKVLANNGELDWKIYYSVLWEGYPYTYHLFLEGQLPSVDYSPGNFVQPIDSFLEAAANDNLPAFSFLEPVWVSAGGFTSYHPSGDVLPGEQALQNIYDALSKSSKWEKTALVVSFSKGGGMYDHVPSQPMTKAWPHDRNDGYNFNTTGTRVPTLVISPLVKKHTVFRSDDESIPYDGTSLAAMILKWFGIPSHRWGMGDRVQVAPTFESVFQLAEARDDLPNLKRAIDKNYPTLSPIPVAAPTPVSATFTDTEGDGVWTYAGNWSGGAVPTDVATFLASANTTIVFSYESPQQINELSIGPGAPSYTFLFDEENPLTPTLTIAGKGVVNQSGNPQTIQVSASNTGDENLQIQFLNAANAGDTSITYKVGPTNADSQSGGNIAFQQTSSAGSASFEVHVGSRRPGYHSTVGAAVRFLNNSTASQATFRVTGTTGADSDTFGNVAFHDYATGGKANFTNVGGLKGDGGNTQFFDMSTADEVTILNEGATLEGGNGGDTAFDGRATAANASITNQGALAGNGGVTSFNNNYPDMAPDCGATAGSAHITNLGTVTGQSGSGGHTEFSAAYGAGDGGSATIDNFGSEVPGETGGGYTLFAVTGRWPYYRPTAANATITNHPAKVAGAQPGSTKFNYTNYDDNGDRTSPGPSAGSATIDNLGAEVPGAAGGKTLFEDEATAGNASISAQAGRGGEPGLVAFSGNADGDQSRIMLQGGTLDATASTLPALNLNTLEVNAGLIELTVGENHQTPVITVKDKFTLDSATCNFNFSLAGTNLPGAPVAVLQAETLNSMQAEQFVGTLPGHQVSFQINGGLLLAIFS